MTIMELDRDTRLTTKERALWLGVREALLLALRAVEVYLGMEQSRPAKRYKGE
ncbi:MAG TPA: hypothetical protein VFT66_15685 [Roseiflexaceae bacterium]|nr:hypothetical protein [Roseiflexaceae bacterium]